MTQEELVAINATPAPPTGSLTRDLATLKVMLHWMIFNATMLHKNRYV